jgi:hypothetical protein
VIPGEDEYRQSIINTFPPCSYTVVGLPRFGSYTERIISTASTAEDSEQVFWIRTTSCGHYHRGQTTEDACIQPEKFAENPDK